jgi:amidase
MFSAFAPVPMPDILSLDATGQLAALEARRISAVELLDASVARHRAVHARLNAVVVTDLDRARRRAQLIDDRRAAGEPMGLLAGLPMTLKDTLDVEAMPASAGLKALLGRDARDATVVARVRAQGAVIWGKTNVPVMAGDWQSYNGLYGATNNPWDATRTPGGSSGGAAAALAAGVTALEIGSDIGGSLRVPASFCGVFSHKPTWGVVPQRGHVPPRPGTLAERDLNVVGPMARSARDLRLLLSVLEEGPLAAKAPSADLSGLRIGLWLEEPGFPLDPEVRAVIETFAKTLARLGCAVESVRPVDGLALMAAYRRLLAPLTAEDMPPARLRKLEGMRGSAKLASRLGLRGDWATQVLNSTVSHREWLAANEERARFIQHLRGVFERHDVLIAPVACVAAFPHDHRPFARRRLIQSDGEAIPYGSMLNWISMATACGLPATAYPAGMTPDGLPVGAQIIGPRGGDGRVLAIAQAIEDALGGFVRPPPIAA